MSSKNKIKIFKSSQKCKGFSLIEILVAIFVFILVMAMLTGTFSSFLKSYSNAKKIQKDAEDAQYAMNLMAKTIRTSGLITVSSPVTAFPLRIFDYSQSSCIEYSYVPAPSNAIGVASNLTANNPASCLLASMPTPSILVGNIANSPSITAVQTNGTTLGKVTISLQVQDSASTIPIQMSVSLRQ